MLQDCASFPVPVAAFFCGNISLRREPVHADSRVVGTEKCLPKEVASSVVNDGFKQGEQLLDLVKCTRKKVMFI